MPEDKLLDAHKVAFITCVNSEDWYEECRLYLEHLTVPAGMSAEVLPVRNAGSMCAGYEMARRQSNAKYKIYMHQDVHIIKKDILAELIARFRMHPKVGMIGIAGAPKLPSTGVWWEAEDRCNCVANIIRPLRIGKQQECVPQDVCAEALDGVLLATQYEVPWREDVFTGWHFYDISMCMEFRRRGYRLLIPRQEAPWVMHETGFKLLGREYGKWRDVFLREYAAEMAEE